MPLGQAVLTGVSPMSPGRIAFTIIGMIAIIVAAYYITYLLGSKTFKLRSGRSITLRDRFAVSKDKSFFVVEAYGKVYIVGVTNHSMTVIDTLDAEAVTEHQESQEQQYAAESGGMRSRMTAGMAEFIRTQILKRGETPRDDGARYDRGSGFGSVYKKTMSKREDEDQTDEDKTDAEDEE